MSNETTSLDKVDDRTRHAAAIAEFGLLLRKSTYKGDASYAQVEDILNSITGDKINKIEISTHHFKGNFPSHCSLQAAYIPSKKTSASIVQSSNRWKTLMKKTSLTANKTHVFKNKLMKNEKINFIKINIFPDGGISRFRIFGKAL